ncbi:GlxA family transcriptional regulator [Streptomyces vinaceus]|uniref:GlxA family transcriptional regulator n=1 Tax=Streptomyces vinaceus TaxID=1960 RepID=A0A5J6JLY9_STRVI|nr:GlxA family transcriptional regulator [Streptomyces vinaceus]QEV49514.1 GlxA family transcriptional regulator [Streptomyces vinaceus]
MRTRTVYIPLFDGVEALDVSGPMAVFAGGNTIQAARSPGTTAYTLRTASCAALPVRSASGLTLLPDEDLDMLSAPHTILVPGLTMDDRQDRAPGVVAWLRENAARAQRVVSVCTGAFLLAEAGVLNGRTVTTHWNWADRLAEEYPKVTVNADPIFIRDGKVSSSAGVTSCIDLALALVEEDLGRDAALVIARYMVVFLRRPGNQKQFSTQLAGQLAHRDNLREVQQWIADHPDGDLGIEALARRAGLSPRQFTRAFTAETGISPGRYVDQSRMETARRLLEETRDSVEHIARASGFPSTEAMRRAFHRVLGVSPAQYRTVF